MKLNESFDKAAQIYDDSRPSYPDEVIDWIIDKTDPVKDEKLLEIGAGTGQATIKFAERGYGIHCVEMGKNLAELLIKKCENFNVTVDISSFELWNPSSTYNTSFIFSATAFHWIDCGVKYRKCYDLLKDNGYLVLLWNVMPDTQVLPIQKAYDLLWEYYPEKRKAQKPKLETENERKQEIVNSGLFTLEDFLDYKWNIVQRKDIFTKAFFSQSLYLSLDEEKKASVSSKVEELFIALDDSIKTDFHTTVYIAKKK